MDSRNVAVSLLVVWAAMTVACAGGRVRVPLNSQPIPSTGVQVVPLSLPTKTFVRKAFEFNYPASWSVDEKDEDFDPDHRFSINSSERSFVRFVIFDPENDPSNTLSIMSKGYEKNMPGATKTEFNQWGAHEGHGVMLQGKLQSVFKAMVRIFAFNDCHKTFVIVEYIPDDEKQRLMAGLRIVEDSFKVSK